LTGVNLTEADLTGATLSETNLTGAILLGATMPDGVKQDRYMEPAAQPA
jgi:uncharacterized protein YjbI with pentapeptide repeats